MKKVFVLFLTLMVAGFAFAGGQQDAGSDTAPAASAEPVEFIIANGAEPESLDPHLIQGVPEHRIYEGLFEGLVASDPVTADAIPGLAESWDVSDDKMTYTFHLRDAVWSDGVAITAQQFVDSWLRILDPATAADYAWFPSMFIQGAAEFNSGEAGPEAVKISAPDDKTFVIELVGPLPYVLGALAHYSFAVVPLHAIEKYGEEWTSPANFVGNGPYVLEEWVPQDKVSMIPNEKYWDRENVKLDRVVYLPIEDQNTAFRMYENGEIDWLSSSSFPIDQITAVEFRDDYFAPPQLSTYYYTFQVENEPFDDVRVRRAFAMSVDRAELVKRITRAGQIPAYSMVPNMAGYPALLDNYESVEEAQKLLAEAGYPGGAGFPKVELLYNTSENHKKIGEYIQQQWEEKLGVTVELVNQEWKTYLAARNQGNFQIARAGWVGDYQDPNTFLDMFITGAGMNGGQYSNAKYDELIAKAATMNPGPDRFKALMEAEQFLCWEDMAVMPLYYYTSSQMIDATKWGGFHENVMDYHPPKDFYLK